MANRARRLLSALVSTGIIAGTALGPTGGLASAATYCADGQFSSKSNPNGMWSYLANGALLTDQLLISGNKLTPCWWNGRQLPYSGVVCKNETKTTQIWSNTVVVPAGYISMDPQDNKSVAVQWTAPAAGTFAIKGKFVGVDTYQHVHPVQVTHNGTVIWTQTITRYNETFHFNLTETVAAGDTIDFVVADPNNELYSLSTGLVARIITAP